MTGRLLDASDGADDLSPASYAATRDQLHGVAEHVLAAEQFRRHGTIRLAPSPGGFRTELPAHEPALLAVAGTDLVTATGSRVPLRGTLGELAAACGVSFGLAGSYAPTSGAAAETVLAPRADAAEVLARALAVGDEALRALLAHHGEDGAPVLWPEHFDVAVTIGEVNFGVSPGDGFEPRPYAYVGPWDVPRGPFWNAPFGAARPLAGPLGPGGLDGPDAVLAFLLEGATAATLDRG